MHIGSLATDLPPGQQFLPLAKKILEQASQKKDFHVNTAGIKVSGDLRLHFGLGDQEQDLTINNHAHGQLAAYTGIPRKYYDLMREKKPGLLSNNINEWLAYNEEVRLVRSLQGTMRAFLSDTYRLRDNVDVAEFVLPMMDKMGLTIISADVTEARLYIKAVDHKIQRDIPKGASMGDGSHHIFDTVCPAMCLSNSEIGVGATVLEMGTLTRACTNLAWFASEGMRKIHLGSRADIGQDTYRLLTDEARQAVDRAFFLQLRDTLANGMSEVALQKRVERIRGSAERKIATDINAVVELVANRFGMNANTRSSVLTHLAEGGSLTQYGLANAVTRAAADETNYDHVSAFEEAGGSIMDLSANDWAALNKGGEVKGLRGGDLQQPELLEAA